jgi:hypothetical protein
MKQVTKKSIEDALSSSAYIHFEHKTLKNKDGSRLRARANGALKEWRRQPDSFRLPIKRGLREYSCITEETMDEWELV